MVSKLLSLSTLLGLTLGAAIPNNNGFPMPNDQQKLEIAHEAGGLLPGGPAPTSLGANSITAFQLIAFNELFETAYFSSLLHNITSEAPGYHAQNKEELVKIFSTVLAVSEDKPEPFTLYIPSYTNTMYSKRNNTPLQQYLPSRPSTHSLLQPANTNSPYRTSKMP